MVNNEYSITVRPKDRLVEVRFSSAANFDLIEKALKELKCYIAEDYKVKVIGYINVKRNYLRAFMLALSLLGYEDRIIFEDKARYHKAERRRSKVLVFNLKSKGYSAKQISESLNIPLKTVYRWLAET